MSLSLGFVRGKDIAALQPVGTCKCYEANTIFSAMALRTGMVEVTKMNGLLCSVGRNVPDIHSL